MQHTILRDINTNGINAIRLSIALILYRVHFVCALIDMEFPDVSILWTLTLVQTFKEKPQTTHTQAYLCIGEHI